MSSLPDYFDPMVAPFAHESEGPDAVLLVHGWTGTPAHFRILGEVLAGEGYSVAAPLLPGHGTRVEDLVRYGWRDWVREVVTHAHTFLERGRRVHLVGLSMGGAICLLVAPILGATSVTTINAPIKVHSRRMWLAPLFRGSSRILEAAPRVLPDGATMPYFHQYDGDPIGAAADLRDLMRAARRHLADARCPALVIQSLRDETVRPESGRIVYSGLGSTDKTLLWLRESRHNALLDAERARVHHAIKGRISDTR